MGLGGVKESQVAEGGRPGKSEVHGTSVGCVRVGARRAVRGRPCACQSRSLLVLPCSSLQVGTPYYVSPEVVRGAGYDWKSDVWSLGCLLYELACLRSPFEMEGANLYDVFQKISKVCVCVCL